VKPVVFHHAALQELDDAVGYYNECAPGLGTDLQARVEAATAQLSENPRQFGFLRSTGFRAVRLKRFPYLVIYLELADTLWIAAIANERRHPDYWRGRVPGQP
jgi:hypothetical protein